MSRRRKRKISIKKITKLTIFFILTLTLLLNLNNIKTFYISKTTGYKLESVSTFLETDIYEQIKNHKYSKTLETILNSDEYNKEYIKEYININYIEDDAFITNISKLLEKGYNSEDINNIYKTLNNQSIDILIKNNYIEDIINLIDLEYFHEDYFERYLKYYEQKEYDPETVITNVNIGLDNDYYTNVSEIENQNSIDVLVNKYNKLQENFVPINLESISYGSGKLIKEAKEAFDNMCKKALEENIKIYGGSGYRSYSYQENLYNKYVKRDGKKEADTYSARAGFSEHQTGLAMDVMNSSWDYIHETDKEYTWLINNSYKYGFILRYPEGKEEITGYIYEPWHYRYVGIEIATEIHTLGITYDEYVAKK